MRNKFLILNMITIFILQFVNQVYITIPDILFAVLILIVFILVKKTEMLGVYIFLILLSTSLMMYYVNIVFVIFFLLKFNKLLKLNSNFLIVISIILIETIHLYININFGINESLTKLLGFSLCLIPFIFIKDFLKNTNILVAFYMFISGFIGFTLITFGIYFYNYNLFDFFNEIRRFGFLPGNEENEKISLIINPNTIGKYAALIISGSIALLQLGKLKLNALTIIILFYTLVIGFLTLSRTFILIFIVIFMIYVTTNFTIKNAIKIVMISILLLCITIIILLNQNLSQALNTRIFESDNITGSRIEIYEGYLRTILQNDHIFIFGVGMQDYNLKFNNYSDYISESSHNVIIEILSIWGVIGLFLILMFIVKTLIQSNLYKIKGLSQKILLCLPVLTIFISALAGQYFISYYHTFCVTFLAFAFIYSDEVMEYD
ncbi:O-antigen ligase family protein [Mammaliicoccus vitulinus]|uniref:O-antigen ligase family protein n=1 Tax=Mammaliicoccus vitulinus TaxID=71237 RepID=UPI000D1F1BC1|nr:O-antigen ligase family protein [Mammaliicoccus vitulinus]PTI71936.1 hypothetical protein BU073_05710 [Mammaliicoccus vitulinus]